MAHGLMQQTDAELLQTDAIHEGQEAGREFRAPLIFRNGGKLRFAVASVGFKYPLGLMHNRCKPMQRRGWCIGCRGTPKGVSPDNKRCKPPALVADRCKPPVERSDDELRALLGPEEFERWKARSQA